MDPIQSLCEDVNPRLETTGSASAVVVDGYETANVVATVFLDWIAFD